ncbi:unnamed protein product, partial [Hapterophycus canaliculatus]
IHQGTECNSKDRMNASRKSHTTCPTIQRKALSGVSQTLEEWFPGLVRSTTASTSSGANR